MADRERLIARLRRGGLKITPQRLAIIGLLEESDHPSVEELYDRLSQQYPMLSRATVYNTLEVLKKLGEVAEVQIKHNVTLYDPHKEPHYHLLCRRCGRVIDVAPVPECNPETLSASLSRDRLKGYKIEGVQVYLYGICPQCHPEGKEFSI